MELLQLLLSALFFGGVFSEGSISIPYVKVILGDSFTLRRNCPTDVEGKLRQTEPQSRDVAAHRDGVWTPEESFRDRISPNSSVVFNRSVYTDGGVYVFMCGGREVSAVQVEVVVVSESSVTEGEASSLSCYYATTAGTCWSVRWVKGGEDVLRRDSCGARHNWTADDRLSLSADWLSHGDLSLNLQRARREDQGDYFCYIQAKGGLPQSGTPAAARLKVSERSPDQTTSTPPPTSVSPTQTTSEVNGLGTLAAVCITAVVFLVFGLVCGWFLKSHCSTYLSRLLRRFGPGDERHDVDGASEPLSHPPPLQMNGHHPSNTSQADV
ncbi:uncharacterized protein LOC120433701 [Oreochromis aureus]|uniref:uncharacterized protein LOC120433701 n=1 Tax=Oreochromis aureus TaxID=47969 RepID=UPI00195358D8|nr:uncharacterized protein LOC120433701 [Oreochromis aureus]